MAISRTVVVEGVQKALESIGKPNSEADAQWVINAFGDVEWVCGRSPSHVLYNPGFGV